MDAKNFTFKSLSEIGATSFYMQNMTHFVC